MNLPFFIARRYLVSKKSHNAINVISRIAVTGICVGTMALVIVLSAFNGLSDLVKSLYNSFGADLRITLIQGKTFELDTLTVERLKSIKGVAYVCPILEENVLVKYNDVQCVATIKGVDEEYQHMSKFDTLIREGYYQLSNAGKDNIVIGSGVAKLLQASLSDIFNPFSIYVPKRGIQNAVNPDDAFNQSPAFVSGVFSVNDDFDFKYMISSIDFARKLLERNSDEVSSIEIGFNPSENNNQIKEEVANIMGDSFVVKNRFQQNEVLFKTLQSEKLWTFIILVFILIVAAFNIIASITMLIIEKQNDIKTFTNLGADNNLIQKIFLTEGALVSFLGAFIGISLGVFICWIQIQFALIRFDEGFVVEAYPVKIEILDMLIILGVVIIVSLFAGWYPVRVLKNRN